MTSFDLTKNSFSKNRDFVHSKSHIVFYGGWESDKFCVGVFLHQSMSSKGWIGKKFEQSDKAILWVVMRANKKENESLW
jgi:hypothetical protein